MIRKIKIYGERNSGTNYLEKLLEKNIKNVTLISPRFKDGLGWKHGYPNLKLFDTLDDILFIFIIRDRDSWLKSMYKNPYHYKVPNNINIFIKKPLMIKEKLKTHDVNVNKLEHRNIMDLRYAKIIKYLATYEKVNHCLMINLESAQKDWKKLLFFLNKQYSITINTILQPITEHVKNKKLKAQNRKYQITLPQKMINNKTNQYIESFVANLKVNYYFK